MSVIVDPVVIQMVSVSHGGYIKRFEIDPNTGVGGCGTRNGSVIGKILHHSHRKPLLTGPSCIIRNCPSPRTSFDSRVNRILGAVSASPVPQYLPELVAGLAEKSRGVESNHSDTVQYDFRLTKSLPRVRYSSSIKQGIIARYRGGGDFARIPSI